MVLGEDQGADGSAYQELMGTDLQHSSDGHEGVSMNSQTGTVRSILRASISQHHAAFIGALLVLS